MTNPLVELQRLGQSPWHDNIRRELLTAGTLARMVADGDITGLTSNPTIFDQAIESGHDYDAQVGDLARRAKSPEEIFDALAITDIRAAADVFAPVYERTGGADGFVSIEVGPHDANDTARTIAEAHRLWKAVAKPNVMVKIPATAEGVPAIEECVADGLNINITLIFSLDRYDEVMEAYLAGLERRLAAGKPVDRIASVASFFVSRVDTEVDKRLDALLATAAPDQAEQLKQLKGRSAIANAKLAYVRFREKFRGARFEALARRGARVQRPLWASTSTKNPSYPDIYYVEALIGADTVDTMPPATIAAYKDHGHPEVRIDRDLDDANAVLKRLADAGIAMDEVTKKLEIDGVASFAKSFDSLIATVARAAAAATRNGGARTSRQGKTTTRGKTPRAAGAKKRRPRTASSGAAKRRTTRTRTRASASRRRTKRGAAARARTTRTRTSRARSTTARARGKRATRATPTAARRRAKTKTTAPARRPNPRAAARRRRTSGNRRTRGAKRR